MKFWFPLLLAAAAVVAVPAQMEPAVTPGIPITCDLSFDVPGRYVLTEDLHCVFYPVTRRILVSANDVEMDLQGHMLQIQGGGLDVVDVSGFTLHNGTIRAYAEMGGNALSFVNVTHSKIEDAQIAAATYPYTGMAITGGGHNVITNADISGSMGSLWMSDSHFNSITNTTFFGAESGLHLYGDDLRFSRNEEYTGSSGTLIDGTRVLIDDCHFAGSLHVRGSDDQVRNSSILWEFTVIGTENMIQGNTVLAPTWGLTVGGTDNMVRLNTAYKAKDLTGSCAANKWRDNSFTTVDPDCIR